MGIGLGEQVVVFFGGLLAFGFCCVCAIRNLIPEVP